jgi:hypothetical protein
MELPFSAPQRLCVPMLERIEVLTGPERGALGAFGRSAGEAADRFLVGLAVLGLLWNSRRSSHSSVSFTSFRVGAASPWIRGTRRWL